MIDKAWNERLCALGFMVEREDGPPACTIDVAPRFGTKAEEHLKRIGILL